jgi:hypothetical protein
MILNPLSRSERRRVAAGLLSVIALSLTACSPSSPAGSQVAVPHRVELLSGDSGILNYTPWYIHRWELSGPNGTGIGGGGRNAMPVKDNGRPSGGSGMCCTSIPHDWQPDLRLTVRWLADKKQDGKTPGYWYKAENVQIAKYDGRQVGDIWAIFLPGDRVRLMVADGNSSGGNDLNHRPPDSDSYIVQGVLDDQWNQLYRKGGNTQ